MIFIDVKRHCGHSELLGCARALAQRPRVFALPDGETVAPGYHVTEVTHASYQSVDCGGQQDAWQQIIVQLKGPSACDAPEHISVSKFLAIYRRVAASVSLAGENELRVEYSDAARAAVLYQVEGLEPDGDTLRVRRAAGGLQATRGAGPIGTSCPSPPAADPRTRPRRMRYA